MSLCEVCGRLLGDWNGEVCPGTGGKIECYRLGYARLGVLAASRQAEAASRLCQIEDLTADLLKAEDENRRFRLNGKRAEGMLRAAAEWFSDMADSGTAAPDAWIMRERCYASLRASGANVCVGGDEFGLPIGRQ